MAFNIFNPFKRNNPKSIPINNPTLSIDPTITSDVSLDKLISLGWTRAANTDGKAGMIANYVKGDSKISIIATGDAQYTVGNSIPDSAAHAENLTISNPQSIFTPLQTEDAKKYLQFEAATGGAGDLSKFMSTNSVSPSAQSPNSVSPFKKVDAMMTNSAANLISQPVVTSGTSTDFAPPVAQSGAGGSTNGVTSLLGPAPGSGGAPATVPTQLENHTATVQFENDQAKKLADNMPYADSDKQFSDNSKDIVFNNMKNSLTSNTTEEARINKIFSDTANKLNNDTAGTEVSIKASPKVIDPSDIIANSQKQAFKDLSIDNSNTTATTPPDQYDFTHKMAQMDKTDGAIVGGTGDLKSKPADNHTAAVNLENQQSDKLAAEIKEFGMPADKFNANLKQVADDNSLDIVSNDKKNIFTKTNSSASGGSGSNQFHENGGPSPSIVTSDSTYATASDLKAAENNPNLYSDEKNSFFTLPPTPPEIKTQILGTAAFDPTSSSANSSIRFNVPKAE